MSFLYHSEIRFVMLPPMTKIGLVLHRSPALPREAFEETLLKVNRDAGSCRAQHQTIHLAYETDALRAEAVGSTPQAARCAALHFRWFESSTTASLSVEPANAIARTDGYRLDEVVHWDRLGDRPAGTRTPGVTMIAFVRRLPELSAADFRARYLEHAEIAREHHPGIARYVQNFVTETLSEGAPPVDGIAELHFATETDLTDRFHATDASVEIVGADVARFMSVRGSWSILATEHVVR